MRKFNVTVNGNLYEVEVEETNGASASAPAAAPVAAPATAAAPKAAPEPVKKVAPASEGAIKINSPMPGTILKVNVTIGQKINKGDVICILEAMKMENDIPAPKDGTVMSVNIQKGASVNSGDVLITLN